MRLTLAVIGLAAASVAQEFIPIGGGSASARQGISPAFGEPFTPSIIDPHDPLFQPANFAGNRPNPIPLFPKTQQAGTPHEAPVDFTFTHQHSYKEPFRSDQTVTSFVNPIGAARPNIPRTLGRENIYIDPRADPNSDISRAEAAKKAKNMIFYGLAPPVEKLHRADEFAHSTVPLQNPWDSWYDRFTEAPADPRRQFLLTQTKRPALVDIPFYAADRGKREVEETTLATEEDTTTSLPTTTLLSDAIGTTTSIAALESTTHPDVAVETETATDFAAIKTTTTTSETTKAVAEETTTVVAVNTTAASTASTTTTTAGPASSTKETPKPVNLTSSAAPEVSASLNSDVVTAPTARRMFNGTKHKSMSPFGLRTAATTPTPFSTGPSIPFRAHNRRLQTANPTSTTVQQNLRSFRTKNPLRSTLGVEKTTHSTTINRHALNLLKADNVVGSAKNSSRAVTTKLPLRTTTFQRRPTSRTRVSLRQRMNATSITATAVTQASPSTTVTATKTSAATTVATTPATATISTQKTLNRGNATTTTRTKAPFRIFSNRPLVPSKLPARTPIIDDSKPAIESNNIGTLRTEVNRLLTTVVQLQSTVIAQQQRIALLENQLRLRRASGRKQLASKTTRFLAADGRTVERTTMDIRKGRSIKLRNGQQVNLRQRSSLA